MRDLNSRSSKDFRPTDDELLQKFLYNKINNEPIPNYLNILEHDLFGTKQNPLDIWNEFEASYAYGGKDLYFFTTLKKKSATSIRSVRTIGNGNWEGEDTGKKIFAPDTNKLLGLKKRFRFEKSNTSQDGGWILHEYNLHESLINNSPANKYVLCRFRKNLKPESQNTQARESIADQSNSQLRKISRTKKPSAQESKENNVMIPKQKEPIIHKQEEPAIISGNKEKTLISKPIEPIIPKQEEHAAISGNNVLVKKYTIYEDAIVEPKIQSNDGGNKREYEDDIGFVCNGETRKCIRSTWPGEKRFLAMKPIFESEYNNLFFGEENIEQNPKNQFESRNSKTEVVERTNQRGCNFNKEDDSDVIMNKEEEEEEEEEGEEEEEEEDQEEEGMSWPEAFAKQLLEINGGEFIKEEDVEMLDNSIHKDIFLGK